jgi:hypothetical protein
MMCTHYACRCARARELVLMADRTGDNGLLRRAVEVHEEQVPCREPCEEAVARCPDGLACPRDYERQRKQQESLNRLEAEVKP